MLALLPTYQLGVRYAKDVAFVDAELAALPVNRAWAEVVAAAQAHRQSAVVAAARPDAEVRRAQAAERAVRAFDGVELALESAPAAPARIEAVARLRTEFQALAAAAATQSLDVGQALARHRAFTDHVFDEVSRLNADAQLLLDPEATTHFSIVAGLQVAPRAGDALSELGSLAIAASVDDIAAMAGASARYRDHAGSLRLDLEQAAAADPRLATQFAPVLEQLDRQRTMVEDTLAAAALDVNYPLDKMSQVFADAAKLQADLSQRVLAAVDAELSSRSRQLWIGAWAVMGLVSLGLVAVGAVLWRTVQGILRPVLATVEVTERIAKGDLSQRVPAGCGDELGRVLAAISAMQARLRELVEQIHASSARIQHAAAEIAAGTQDLSQRTEHTAASLQKTAGAMQRIGDSTGEGAASARQANALAERASDAARRGGQVVSEVVSTMEGIHTSSQRIAEITAVIDGIAFQTNILALNAAVEAARSGEQGRGFAVVAAEVRMLAQRSAQAAREIKSLIQSSVERIDEGNRLAGEAGAVMGEIVDSVGQVSQVMAVVATKVQGQSASVGDVRSAVARLDAMTQQNAALVEQSAAAAESMRDQASRMHDLVGMFQLRTEG
ncbi:MAG TPA: methyl-accepting chemotaxis protein [Methylibium sp.]|nr:methyl-accepting chemotaxis protein [Methylibium sp.]